MGHIVRWFVGNPMAANILMLALLVGGWAGFDTLKKEVFPSPDMNVIQVSMSYPGAAPTEVEQQIVIRVEEAIAGLPGIFQITSESREGLGVVNIEVIDGYDVKEVLNDVKARVDAIITFPATAERPVISQRILRETLMWFSISGDADMTTLKQLAYRIRDEMPLLEGVSEVAVTGMFMDEISIEISEENLRRFNLTFSDVATAVRQSSLNVPAGTIKSDHGNVQIQTREQAYSGEDFADIVVRSFNDGSQLLLKDIAVIKDGFAEQDLEFILNNKTALNFEAKLSDDPNLFGGTANARKYLNELQKTLPGTLTLKIGYEGKSMFDGRFNLLRDNALSGLFLVFIILMLFLRPLLAVWVVVGIATAFSGAIWMLPYFDVSFNMLSMFAFLMVLGIVVDDAIIVGESIFSRQSPSANPRDIATAGAVRVLMPVVMAVVSTIIFFSPMMDVPVSVEPYTRSIFMVVFFCLVFSLVESLLILPSHLSHMKPETESRFLVLRKLAAVRKIFSTGMADFAVKIYQPFLKQALERRISTILAFIVLFATSLSLFATGWVGSAFFPQIDQPYINIHVAFPEGSPYRYSTDLTKHMKLQAEKVQADAGLLAKNNGKPFIFEINTTADANTAGMFVGLTPNEERGFGVAAVSAKLREFIGPIPEAQSYSLDDSFGGSAPDIALNLKLNTNSTQRQQEAVNKIQKVLAAYPGVSNVRSDLDTGRMEIELSVMPYAQTLGTSMADIATQMRQAFYGEEIQRIPRSKEDVKVMLRYTENERRTLDTLDNMRIRTPQQIEVPLESVAKVDMVPGASTIRRTDRVRNIAITADVIDGQDPNEIVNQMLGSYNSQWQLEYPGFNLSTEGNLRAQAQFGENFKRNFFFAFVVTLALFAIAFRSIFEPFLVLIAVPFGFMGAVFGHLLLGYQISMFSFFGFLACSGVVVNDNLVLMDRINQLRKKGLSALEAVSTAGVDRFRPIVLTSLTTFVGLMPILFERSTQAQFLIPMVIALSFGVLLSSVVTLVMVPCVYLSGHTIGSRLRQIGSAQWQKISRYLGIAAIEKE